MAKLNFYHAKNVLVSTRLLKQWCGSVHYGPEHFPRRDMETEATSDSVCPSTNRGVELSGRSELMRAGVAWKHHAGTALLPIWLSWGSWPVQLHKRLRDGCIANCHEACRHMTSCQSIGRVMRDSTPLWASERPGYFYM